MQLGKMIRAGQVWGRNQIRRSSKKSQEFWNLIWYAYFHWCPTSLCPSALHQSHLDRSSLEEWTIQWLFNFSVATPEFLASTRSQQICCAGVSVQLRQLLPSNSRQSLRVATCVEHRVACVEWSDVVLIDRSCIPLKKHWVIRNRAKLSLNIVVCCLLFLCLLCFWCFRLIVACYDRMDVKAQKHAL